MKKSDLIKLITSIVLCVSLGAVGGLVTVNEIPTWYASLNKPSFNPPNWLFGPVWTTLYFLMGVSAYLIWKQPVSIARNQALQLFILQFLFNFCWSFIFFGLHATGWALIEMIALWILILMTILHFAKHSKLAAWLLVPYISWVSFALLLNAAIWRLN